MGFGLVWRINISIAFIDIKKNQYYANMELEELGQNSVV